MVEVYFYLPSSEVDDVVECGLKLSRWHDREVYIDGQMQSCLAALLHPKDDMEKYDSPEFTCTKLQVNPRNCFVAERCFYIIGQSSPKFMDMYRSCIIPVQEYVFGSFRLPECLVNTTVLSEQLAKLDKRIDSPMLYRNSEELFLNNLMESLEENEKETKDSILHCYFDAITRSSQGRYVKHTGEDMDVFVDKRSGKAFPMRRPGWTPNL